MLKETHTISYIQQANHEWIEGDEEEIVYVQTIESLKHMELLGRIDFIISSWECQGFSVARFGKRLSDIRSGLFTDMIRLITSVQFISPTFGYVIKNTPSQPNQREKV
jgi:site-specific DNA-cytosine methylase